MTPSFPQPEFVKNPGFVTCIRDNKSNRARCCEYQAIVSFKLRGNEASPGNKIYTWWLEFLGRPSFQHLQTWRSTCPVWLYLLCRDDIFRRETGLEGIGSKLWDAARSTHFILLCWWTTVTSHPGSPSARNVIPGMGAETPRDFVLGGRLSGIPGTPGTCFPQSVIVGADVDRMIWCRSDSIAASKGWIGSVTTTQDIYTVR